MRTEQPGIPFLNFLGQSRLIAWPRIFFTCCCQVRVVSRMMSRYLKVCFAESMAEPGSWRSGYSGVLWVWISRSGFCPQWQKFSRYCSIRGRTAIPVEVLVWVAGVDRWRPSTRHSPAIRYGSGADGAGVSLVKVIHTIEGWQQSLVGHRHIRRTGLIQCCEL